MINGPYIYQLTKSLNSIKLVLFYLAKLYETLAEKKCDSIVKKWQMYFQASDLKGKNFLNLNDNDGYPICLSYSKSGTWLQHFSHFNSLCTHITRLITNHIPIDKYRIRFFPNKSFACPYSNSPFI